MTIINLEELVLRSGSHPEGDEGCVMEWAARMAGESWSDHPACVSPVIGAFLRSWNDGMRSDAERDQLKRYLAARSDGGVIGTAPASHELENRRSWLAVDWYVRVHTPAWLRLAHLEDQAKVLEQLPELNSRDAAAAIRPALEAVRKDARAARTASYDRLRKAAGAAEAAWAAWAAEAAEAAEAAGAAGAAEAAEAAEAAGAAGAAEAAGAAGAAWAAEAAEAAGAAFRARIREGAREHCQPTVERLQESAHELVARMIALDEPAA